MLVLGDEAAHRGEARQDQRVHARLGAAGDHRVGVAALDQLGRLADRVRAGRAGGDDGVVGALDPERDRDLSRGRVDEDVRQEARRDAVGAAVAEDVVLLHDPQKAADRRTEEDPDPVRVEVLEPRVAHRLVRCGDGEEHVPLELSRLLRRDQTGRVEVLHLGGDPHRKARGVERADPVDTALSGERRAPGRRRVEAERGDGSDTGDGDTSHSATLTVGFVRACSLDPVSADGSRARARAAGGRRLAVRAEMGRLSRRARERRRKSSRSGRGTSGRCCATSPSCVRSASCCRRGRRSTARSSSSATVSSTSTRCRCGCTRPSRGSGGCLPRFRPQYVVFDLLLWEGEPVWKRPLRERRAELERVGVGFQLSPCTLEAGGARAWLAQFEALGLDGVVAKRLGLALPAGLARRHGQGQGAQDRRLRRSRRSLEGRSRGDRDPSARPLPRRRRPRLRRLVRGRGREARRGRDARDCRCSRTTRTGASRSRTGGAVASSKSRACGRNSSSRCATTRCREIASATARS